MLDIYIFSLLVDRYYFTFKINVVRIYPTFDQLCLQNIRVTVLGVFFVTDPQWSSKWKKYQKIKLLISDHWSCHSKLDTLTIKIKKISLKSDKRVQRNSGSKFDEMYKCQFHVIFIKILPDWPINLKIQIVTSCVSNVRFSRNQLYLAHWHDDFQLIISQRKNGF